MSAGFSTVKLNARLVDEARREADLFRRSLAGQIEHWAQLGRAVENAQGVSIEQVRSVLAGETVLERLSAADQDVAFSALADVFAKPGADVVASYAALGARQAAARARRATAPRKTKPAA